MRTVCGLLFACLLLAACGGLAPASPSAGVTSATPAGVIPSATAAPLQVTPTLQATGSPASLATATVVAPAAADLPAYLRTLNFGVPAGNSYYPRALGVHPGLKRLYARTRGLGWEAPASVAVLDPDTGEVLRVVETGADEFSDGDLAVDALRSRVYVVDPDNSTASVLDAGSLKSVATIADVKQLALDAQAGQLVTAGAGDLRLLDAPSHDVLRQVALPAGDSPFDLALDATLGRIYLAVQDPEGYSLLTYDTQDMRVLNTLRLPGQPEALVADPVRGRAYITSQDSQNDLLWTVDGGGALLEERRLGDWSRRTVLALDGPGGRLFLGRDEYTDYGVDVLNVENGQQVAEISLEYAPYSLLWDGESYRLWVSFTYHNLIADVDMQTGRVHASYPTAVGITDVAVDPERGNLLVADTINRLHVVDSESDRELALLPGGDRLAVDSAHARYYTGGWYAPTVRVFDADRLVEIGEIPFKGVPVADAHAGGLYIVNQGIHLTDLDTLSVTGVISDTLPQSPGYSPNPTAVDAAVDPGTGRIFAVISNGVPGSNGGTYLYVYEPVTYEKVLEDTERSPSYLDIDPANGWAYISRTHLAGSSTSLLVDGRTYTARVDSLFGGLRLDPTRGRVYVTVQGYRGGQIYVLDAATLDVLDSVPIPEGYNLRALDPRRHWLYLVREDGLIQVWSTTGGRYPSAEQPEPSDLAEAQPYRLFVPRGEGALFALDIGWTLYRSDDAGESWGRVVGGLPKAMTADLAASPGFEADHTLFAGSGVGTQAHGVWRSADGGNSWRLASRGLTDLSVRQLAISPAFGSDRTLFASTNYGGLYRSTDGGESWAGLTHLYRPPNTYPGGPTQLLLSPTYGQDRTLFIEHYGYRRSDDGGDTWHALGDVGSGYFYRQLILAPDYASSHVVYCLSISLETGGLAYLLGSSDGGDTWTDLGIGPVPEQMGDGRLLVAPGGVVYLAWRAYYPGTRTELFRSSSIAPVNGEPASLRWARYTGVPLEPATPLELSGDGTALVALDASGRLLRWPLADLAWQPVASPTPMPTPTPSPTVGPCSVWPDRFRAAWEPNRVALGCATEEARQLQLAEQPFEQGRMIWDSTTRTIYVLLDLGTWQAFPDTWQEGVDPAWDPALKPPPDQPQRGFGKVWREQLGGPASAVGWALENERSVDGWKQRFERGWLFWTDLRLPGAAQAGAAFLLLDDGTWLVTPAP